MRYADFSELKTPRLVLRKLTREDIPFYYARLAGSREVTQYMLFQPHQDLSESEASIAKALRRYEEGRFYRWAIDLPGSGLIGMIDLLAFEEDTESCSFAYMLGTEFWGKGYGTEALKSVLDFGFREMELKRIHADHFGENTASGAVMRKVGMEYAGTVPGKYEKNGRKYDAPRYEITREQWK